ncbi:MAG: putative toxin-antitoxin system toxin component, PIN family [Thermomicrobiales bacterium]
MRIVLDVNILASAALKDASVPGLMLKIATGPGHELVISDVMMAELRHVLQRPFFLARISAPDRREFAALVWELVNKYDPDPTVTGVADDEEDDRVLGTAVAANADVIVTGDKGMLRLVACHGIPIVTARQFFALVEL